MWYLLDILSATKSLYTRKHTVIRYQPESSKRTFLSLPLPSPITRYYLEWNKTSNPINPEKNKIRTPIYPNLCYRLTSYNGSPPNTNCNLIRTNPSSKWRGQSSYSSLYQTSPEKISFTPFVMFFSGYGDGWRKSVGEVREFELVFLLSFFFSGLCVWCAGVYFVCVGVLVSCWDQRGEGPTRKRPLRVKIQRNHRLLSSFFNSTEPLQKNKECTFLKQ